MNLTVLENEFGAANISSFVAIAEQVRVCLQQLPVDKVQGVLREPQSFSSLMEASVREAITQHVTEDAMRYPEWKIRMKLPNLKVEGTEDNPTDTVVQVQHPNSAAWGVELSLPFPRGVEDWCWGEQSKGVLRRYPYAQILHTGSSLESCDDQEEGGTHFFATYNFHGMPEDGLSVEEFMEDLDAWHGSGLIQLFVGEEECPVAVFTTPGLWHDPLVREAKDLRFSEHYLECEQAGRESDAKDDFFETCGDDCIVYAEGWNAERVAMAISIPEN